MGHGSPVLCGVWAARTLWPLGDGPKLLAPISGFQGIAVSWHHRRLLGTLRNVPWPSTESPAAGGWAQEVLELFMCWKSF